MAYLESAQLAGHETELIDLYHEPHQDYLRVESIKNPETDPYQAGYHTKIKWADEISFFMPLWWMSPPAIMKNFMDVNFNSGFAFRYHHGRPIGLLKGRQARTFMTCDSPKIFYQLMLMPFRTVWNLTLHFCGLKALNFTLYDRVRSRSQAEIATWLRKTAELNKQ
jgi:putative NADPH-quinone reductase